MSLCQDIKDSKLNTVAAYFRELIADKYECYIAESNTGIPGEFIINVEGERFLVRVTENE